MSEIEPRIVIEELKPYSQTLRSTSVRKGNESVWISTARVQQSNPDLARIETITGRIKGIIAKGKEGLPEFTSRGLVPLLPFTNHFPLDDVERALNFHSDVIESIASHLEDDVLSIELIETEQLGN